MTPSIGNSKKVVTTPGSKKMGKFPQSLYTDTETDTSSSVENLKKKRKPSILKYTSTSNKKKKCKYHSISEPDYESDYRTISRSVSRGRGQKKLQGILKHPNKDDKDRGKDRFYSSSEEDDEPDRYRQTLPPDKFLVGRVPVPPGGRPGRGGGVALIVRKAVRPTEPIQPKQTSSSSKKSHKERRLSRKRSY